MVELEVVAELLDLSMLVVLALLEMEAEAVGTSGVERVALAVVVVRRIWPI